MALKIFSGAVDVVEPTVLLDRDEARRLIDEYVDQAGDIDAPFFVKPSPKDCEAGNAILETSRELQAAVVMEVACRMSRSSMFDERMFALRSLLESLLRRTLPFDNASVESLLQIMQVQSDGWEMPLLGIFGAVEKHIEQYGMSERMAACMESLSQRYHAESSYAEERKLGKRIRGFLDGARRRSVAFDLDSGEAWTDALLAHLGQLDDTMREYWQTLLAHCATAKSSKPSKKWLKQAREFVDTVGDQGFAGVVIPCLQAIGQPGASQKVIAGGWTHYTEPTQIHSTHVDLLRGLIWTAGLVENHDLLDAVGDAAERCFQKIPNVGPRSPKAGNACLQAFTSMNSLAAVARISRLKSRAKHASIQKQLAKALERAAQNMGLSESDLEELAAPRHGMIEIGRYERRLGCFVAELVTADSGKTQLRWLKANGTRQKTVPASIKETYADEIKAIKRNGKEIEKSLTAQRERLDQLFLKQRSWTVADFRTRLLDHPLVGVLARRLIWRFQSDAGAADGIYHDGGFVDANEQPLDWIDDETRVAIWHPLLSAPEEVLAWREWLEQHEMRQPFKQAHREIFVLTDAERETRTYSNRFAAHIVRQHQFAALCRERGWRYTLQGAWDSANTPSLELSEWGMCVEFCVESIDENPELNTSEMGIYLCLSTDQLCFRQLGSGVRIPLDDVPQLVLSEVMRDVDLFVGVCSVGNDPTWAEDGRVGHHLAYWRDFAFGDLSQSAVTRKEVLQRIIPRLKIADRCSFSGKFLIVRGDIRTYQIHLGSSNVRMTPADQYLCIVPKRGAGAKRTDNLFLPFEGDSTLAIILSKAFLLADDSKIKDDSILSQIRNK